VHPAEKSAAYGRPLSTVCLHSIGLPALFSDEASTSRDKLWHLGCHEAACAIEAAAMSEQSRIKPPQSVWATLLLAASLALPGTAILAQDSAASSDSMPELTYPDPETEAEEIAIGMASYYGKAFAGRPTASGERFDPRQLTAAHPTLPFGSQVRVTHQRSGQSVVVRINDRGPFHGSRVIDVSEAAARQLGLIGPGTGKVSLSLMP